MTKSVLPTEPLEVVGFYQPHRAVNWTGEVLDPKTGELVKEPSMTKQSFKEECDINTIVRRFEATGIIDHVNEAAQRGLYTDLPDGVDLQAALDQVNQAEAAFMALPAAVRAHFDNDPVRCVDSLSYPTEEVQELFIKHGIAKDLRPRKPPAEVPAPASTPSSPAGGAGNGGGAP